MDLPRKITASFLVFVLTFILVSCTKADREETVTTGRFEQEFSETVTERMETKNLTATDSDFVALTETVRGVWLSSSNTCEEGVFLYNKSFDSALDDAMQMIFNEGVGFFSFAEEIYNISLEPEKFSFYDDNGKPVATPEDPLGMFYPGMPGSFGYLKFEAEKIDWMLENIFSVEPDKNYINEHMGRYYFDGYYYFRLDEGGGGGYTLILLDYEEQSDGSYLVTFSTHEEGYEFETEYSILEASAVLREVDGKRIWQISYLKVNEVIQVTEN